MSDKTKSTYDARRLRRHDPRHTDASHAVMSCRDLPLVGKLLGQGRHRTMAAYALPTDTHFVDSAEKARVA